MQEEFQRLVECGKYEAFKSNPLVLTDFEASPFYEGVREPDRSGLAPNLSSSQASKPRGLLLGAWTIYSIAIERERSRFSSEKFNRLRQPG